MTRNIWMYWHQGFSNAPEIIATCVQQWNKTHPNWKIHLLDQKSVFDFIDDLPIKQSVLMKMSLAHRSDLIRTQLLIKYGGVWADPTCFPTCNLDTWLPKKMQADFFFFYNPGPDRIISNWFIAAKKNNFLLKMIFKSLVSYWNNNDFKNLYRKENLIEKFLIRIMTRNLYFNKFWFSFVFTKLIKIYPYMVYHYMVYFLISKNKKINEKFNLMPKYYSSGPHIIQKKGIYEPLSPSIKKIIDSNEIPLFKLTWKESDKNSYNNTNFSYLVNRYSDN